MDAVETRISRQDWRKIMVSYKPEHGDMEMWLICVAMGKDYKLIDKMQKNADGSYPVVFSVGGVELDFGAVAKRIDEQISELVNNKAHALLHDKYEELVGEIYEIQERLENQKKEFFQYEWEKESNQSEKIIEENQKKITDMWNGIISMLPSQPGSFDTSDDPGFWTNGEEILCPSEAEMNMVYEFLNDIFSEFGNYILITGWYDPEEDRLNGEQDDYTGFNYIRLE